MPWSGAGTGGRPPPEPIPSAWSGTFLLSMVITVSVHRDMPANTCRSIGRAGLTPAATFSAKRATAGHCLYDGHDRDYLLGRLLCRHLSATTVGLSNSISKSRGNEIVKRKGRRRRQTDSTMDDDSGRDPRLHRASAEESRPREIDEMASENECV